MLKIWTANTNTALLKSFFQPLLAPTGLSHQVIPITPEFPQLDSQDVLLVLGAKGVDKLKKLGVVKKNLTINALRETVIDVPTYSGVGDSYAKALVSYDPAITFSDATKKPEVIWDIKLAVRLASTGKIEPDLSDCQYRYVDSFNDTIAVVKQRYEQTGKAVDIALDLETIGLDPFANGVRIVSVGFSHSEGQGDLYYVPESGTPPEGLLNQIKALVTSDKVKLRGANLKFDMVWLAVQWGVEISNFTFDTTLVGNLIDENRSNSLETHTKIYTDGLGGYDSQMNKSYDKSRMDLIPKGDLLQYAAGDIDATNRVANVLRPKLLKDRQLANFYVRVLHPASKAFAKIEQRGVLVDRGRYEEVRQECQSEITRLEQEAFGMMPKRIRLKYKDNLKLSRSVILKEYLFTPRGLNLKPQMYTAKAKAPTWEYASTALEHLEMFNDVPEAQQFVDIMREYNSATKTMSTYIVGFLKHLRPDGRFHSNYLLHKGDFGGGGEDAGTLTGRTSARDPAYQTIPKHTKWAKPLRSVYVPPPGYSIIKLDYSQGELRLISCVGPESTMLKAYQNGWDLHSLTASRLMNVEFEEFMQIPPVERAEFRFKAKAANFGLSYGMGVAGFQAYARKGYGLIWSLEEAEQYRNAFFELYHELFAWHKKYKDFAHKHEYVRSPLGRVRHLPLINSKNNEIRAQQERQAVNSVIQGCLSDFGLMAIGILDRMYPNLWMFGFTHDEIQFYVPTEDLEMWGKRIKGVMENLPLQKWFGWNPPVTFVADAEASDINLAECKELDLAA